jgi:phytoene dehydrogenase-like protein
MSRPPASGEVLDCAIVGGGLAGVSAGLELARAGRSVHVVEAEDALGGRARTVWHRGRPVDVGFQALFSAYPATRAFVRAAGLPRRDLRPIAGGAAFNDGSGWERFRPGPGGLARFGGVTAGDRVRLGLLAADVAVQRPEALLGGGEIGTSTEAYLRARGFSERAIEGFFRPFFGSVLADRSLAADAAYFRFLTSMLARGPAVIPSDGHGMLSEWGAAAIRQRGGVVETGARAAALEPDGDGRRLAGVRMEDGRVLRARQVVLAVAAPSARGLLGAVDPEAAGALPDHPASSATAAFALERPLYAGRTILVNAARETGDGPRVDLLCQTTNITRPGAPEGPHVVLATSVTTGGGGAEGLVEAVGRLVARWSPRFPWASAAEPIGVYEHRFAQFRPLPGVRGALPGHRTALDNLILAGDLTAHPSIEGAVSSGARAAGIVDALIP